MVPVASADSTDEAPLSTATHLLFANPPSTKLSLETPTRFTVNDFKVPVDLRSIYFAWVNRDLLIPEYNAAATRLNEELAASGSGATVHKLTFVERVNLITWIEGGGESEYIKPLPGEKEPSSAAAEALKSSSAPAATARSGKGTLDPRLQVIYAGERKMGDRNSILRGSKLIVSARTCPSPRLCDSVTYCLLTTGVFWCPQTCSPVPGQEVITRNRSFYHQPVAFVEPETFQVGSSNHPSFTVCILSYPPIQCARIPRTSSL